MPRKPLGERPLTPAERQARRRVKAKEQPKWEYEVANHHGDPALLNAYGEHGWELAAVYDQWAYFKRRIMAADRGKPG